MPDKPKKLPKASELGVQKTLGRQPMHANLYNLTGLSLGMLSMIKRFCEENAAHPLAGEVAEAINVPENQTFDKTE